MKKNSNAINQIQAKLYKVEIRLVIHCTINDYSNVNYAENDSCRRAIDRNSRDFQDTLKNPDNGRNRDQEDCNGK